MPDRSVEQQLPDLLRERRLELGLLEPAGSWQPMRPLLLSLEYMCCNQA